MDLRFIDRVLGLFGIVTINRMENRIMELRRIDAVNTMEFLDELDDRFRELDSQSVQH